MTAGTNWFRDEFEGKSVVVTGAASGLGRVVALAFAASGANVVMVDVDGEGLQETAGLARRSGGVAFAIRTDLTGDHVGEEVVAASLEEYGGLNVLVNVAGIFHFNPIDKILPTMWDKVFSVNVRAPFLLCQAALPHLIERDGAIVNIASSSAFFGHAYLTAYAASKAALVSLTKSLAMEYAHKSIRINALAPGGMNTPMVGAMTSMPEGVDRSLVSRYAGLRPPNDPEDLVDLVLFLASSRASAVHGSCFTADGGITAG